MGNCKKCGMYKISDKDKCLCNVKKFDENKLSKQTKKPTKPKTIPKISEKKKIADKQRGNVAILFKKIAKKRLNKHGEGTCEFCRKPFNIKGVINQTVCFAHILSKGDVFFKYLAMFENNIALVCSETCHKDMDQEICELKIKNQLQKRIEKREVIDVSDLNKYIV